MVDELLSPSPKFKGMFPPLPLPYNLTWCKMQKIRGSWQLGKYITRTGKVRKGKKNTIYLIYHDSCMLRESHQLYYFKVQVKV